MKRDHTCYGALGTARGLAHHFFTAPPAANGHGYAQQTETLIDGNIVKQSADGGETCFAFGAAAFRQRSPWYMEVSK